MIQKIKSRITFAERILIGKAIIAQQPAITYAEALSQVQRLKNNSKETSSKEGRGAKDKVNGAMVNR